MEVLLQPVAKPKNRVLVLGIVMLALLFVPYLFWWVRIALMIPALIMAGTYRNSSIKDDKFHSQFFFAFIPLKPQKCNLPGVMYIETKYNAVGYVPNALPVLGPLQYLMGTFLDLMAPTLGGAYEIWIVTAKGREIAAWQGISQQHFDDNVALLKANTQAELRGRSK